MPYVPARALRTKERPGAIAGGRADVTTDQILDRMLIPRPNGSQGLEQVADFIATRRYGAEGLFNL